MRQASSRSFLACILSQIEGPRVSVSVRVPAKYMCCVARVRVSGARVRGRTGLRMSLDAIQIDGHLNDRVTLTASVCVRVPAADLAQY